MSWEEAVSLWKQDMRSDYTRHSFGVAVSEFFKWSGEDLESLSYDTLDGWVFALADRASAHPKLGRHITSGTMNKYLLALKLFLRFCVKKEWLTSLTSDQLEEVLKKWPAEVTRHYEVLDQEQIAAILDAAKSKRDYCILALGIYAGLRNFEICSLEVGHICKDAEGAYIDVHLGKGRKSAIVPIDERLYTLLRVYAGTRAPGERMWVISTYHLRAVVKECARRAGIEKRITPHSLRHSYAYWLAKQKVPLEVISKFLRHSSLAITKVYIDHLTREDVAQYVPAFPG